MPTTSPRSTATGPASWTAADIPDQRGRTIVVTGANSGLGLATTHALTLAGAHVVMACRSADRARAARDELPARSRERTEVARLDLADLTDVARFARELRGRPIDVLVNNAGVMNIPLTRTAQGHEMQFGVNALAHLALTLHLEGQLTDRVVWLGSLAHRLGRMGPGDLADLDYRRQPYRRMSAYGRSKLACLLLGYECQRRFVRTGSGLRSMVAHPGYSATNLQLKSGNRLVDAVMRLGNSIPVLAQGPGEGALPELFAATDPDLAGGSYIGPSGPGQLQGPPRQVGSDAASYDRRAAAELWRRCTEMIEQAG